MIYGHMCKSLWATGGWVTEDIDLKVVPCSGQLGKKTSEESYILLLSFAYEEGKYAIKKARQRAQLNNHHLQKQ